MFELEESGKGWCHLDISFSESKTFGTPVLKSSRVKLIKVFLMASQPDVLIFKSTVCPVCQTLLISFVLPKT